MSSSESRQSARVSNATGIPSSASTAKGFYTSAQSSARSTPSSSSSMSPVSRLFVGRSPATKKRSSASTDKSRYTSAHSERSIRSSSSCSSSSSPSSSSSWNTNEDPPHVMTTERYYPSTTTSPSKGREIRTRNAQATAQPLYVDRLQQQLTDAKCRLIIQEAQLSNNEYDGDITQMRQRIKAQQDSVEELVQQFDEVIGLAPKRGIAYDHQVSSILEKYKERGLRIAIFKRQLRSLLAYRAEAGNESHDEKIRQLRRVIWDQQRQIAETKREREHGQ